MSERMNVILQCNHFNDNNETIKGKNVLEIFPFKNVKWEQTTYFKAFDFVSILLHLVVTALRVERKQ